MNANWYKVTCVGQEDVSSALGKSASILEWLWQGLPAACKIVTAALAEKSVISTEQLKQLLYEKGIHTVLAELEEAPRVLINWDIIEECPGGYRFRVELFRQWVAREKSLITVIQQEGGQIRKEADQAFQAGKASYQNQQWDEACEKLHQAIRINPYHIDAYQLLAKVYVERGDRSQAIEWLRNCMNTNPI